MKLSKVCIKNYRSIESIDLEIDGYGCKVFVGINEAGKSNILKALRLLSPVEKNSIDDLRIGYNDETDDAEVYFDFTLDKEFLNKEVDKFIKTIYGYDKVYMNGGSTIREFLLEHNVIIYNIDLKSQSKGFQYYNLDEDIVLKTSIVKLAEGKMIEDFVALNEEKCEVSKYKYFNKTYIPQDKIGLFEDVPLERIYDDYRMCIKQLMKDSELLNVIYWRYSNEYLLPNAKSIDEFITDPNSCMPLKSMFLLAGINQISEKLTDLRSKPGYRMDSLLDQVAHKSTEYLKSVWKECGDVEFYLKINGNNIDIGIQDVENKYGLELRSDGFKRFITFLLMLSAKVKNGEVKDAVIIIDEPDIAMHISGQKYLMDELLRIASSNYVFYSTHSIFMIDKENINRHYIVEKKEEKTNIKMVSESNYTNDEVINNALGYSIFSCLKNKNIIFEGWADQNVFNMMREYLSIDFYNVGIVFTHGVKEIIQIGKIMELANKKYIVISDSDRPASDARKKFNDDEKCSGKWYLYNEILDDIYTLEDFVKHDVMIDSIKKLSQEYQNLNEFDEELFKRSDKERIKFIESNVKKIFDSQEAKEIIRKIKNEVYSNIMPNDIEKNYLEFLEKIRKIV